MASHCVPSMWLTQPSCVRGMPGAMGSLASMSLTSSHPSRVSTSNIVSIAFSVLSKLKSRRWVYLHEERGGGRGTGGISEVKREKGRGKGEER